MTYIYIVHHRLNLFYVIPFFSIAFYTRLDFSRYSFSARFYLLEEQYTRWAIFESAEG